MSNINPSTPDQDSDEEFNLFSQEELALQNLFAETGVDSEKSLYEKSYAFGMLLQTLGLIFLFTSLISICTLFVNFFTNIPYFGILPSSAALLFSITAILVIKKSLLVVNSATLKYAEILKATNQTDLHH